MAGHKYLNDWCKDEAIFHTDDKGVEYCVFHAPLGMKGCAKEEFEQKLAAWIKRCQLANRPITLSGTVFEWEIDFEKLLKSKQLNDLTMNLVNFCEDAYFDGILFTGEITNFSNAIFAGVDFAGSHFLATETYFSGAQFKSGTADFEGAEFKSKHTDFGSSFFSGDVFFTDANFFGEILSFSNAHFTGTGTYFEDILFTGKECNFISAFFLSKETYFKNGEFFGTETNFSDAQFAGENTDFSNAIFKGDVIFKNVQFHNFSNFKDTNFHNQTNFYGLKSLETIDFSNTWFWKNINFVGSIFKKGIFYNARFEGEVDFTETYFYEIADFSESHFDQFAYFSPYEIQNNAYFSIYIEPNNNKKIKQTFTVKNNVFNNNAKFQNIISIERLRFEKANLNGASFIDTDGRMIDFRNCSWGDDVNSRITYDERQLSKTTPLEKGQIKRVETLYRQFKQKAKENHDEAEASLWHFREKLMRMKRLILRDPILILYWLSSGFAEKPLIAGGFLVSIILAFASSLTLLTEFGDYDFKNQLLIIAQYVTFEKEPLFKPELFLGYVHKIAARILIPLQATFFALALRNRFRR